MRSSAEPSSQERELVFSLSGVGLSYRTAASLPWRRKEFWALEDVSFEVFRGETVGVIGRNGAGKSSLLRVLAGILDPDRGIIQRGTVTCTMLAFGAGFEARLSGRQNIVLSGLQLGMSLARVRSKEAEIAELADLGSFIDEPVHTYSTGMRARLGFAIAYFVETDVLLIDEALATGDESFRRKATKLIKERIRSNLTVIIVSHSMALMEELCDRIVQIEDGRSLPELARKETIERYRAMGRSGRSGRVQGQE